MRPSVAILGAGSMGTILCQGLLRAGWVPEEIVMAARREEGAAVASERTGVTTVLDVAVAVEDRQVVVIAVKPADVHVLVAQIKDAVVPGQTVLSLVAGVPVALLESALGDVAVVRAMPNTPAAVDQGMTAYCGGEHSDDASLALAAEVLSAVGETMQLNEELLDAVTAVSGTGPAYVYLLAESLIEAAIREGLPHHAASKLVEQTLKGAGMLLAEEHRTPFELRAQVTSPGGTTAAAMHVLMEGSFRALIEDAVRAAAQRSRELGAQAEAREG